MQKRMKCDKIQKSTWFQTEGKVYGVEVVEETKIRYKLIKVKCMFIISSFFRASHQHKFMEII